MIMVENLVCGYGGEPVINGLSFALQEKEFLGIIGPNGSGKTTLLRSLTQVVTPTEGAVQLNGKDIGSFSSMELARNIAVVRQNADLNVQITVEEFVLLGRTPYMGRWQFLETAEDHQIAEQAMEMTDTLGLRNRYVNTLSGGERQLAVIARALVQKTDVLILDEPTNHLDITHQVVILDLVKRLSRDLNITVIAVLHDLNLASEYCDRLLLLNDGRIHSSGTPSEVLTYQNIEDVYKTPVIVKENPLSNTPHVFLVSEQSLQKDRQAQ